MKKLNLLTALFVSFLLTTAFAYEEGLHFLTVGEGISSPSVTTTLRGQNPAGMIYTDEMHVHVFGANTDVEGVDGLYDDHSVRHYGGFFSFGNGNLAGSVGAVATQFTENDFDTPSPTIHIGLAYKAEAINTSFGFGGRLFDRIEDGEFKGSNDLDIGAIWGIEGPLKVGVTMFDLLGNQNANEDLTIRNYGLGASYYATSEAVVTLDALYSTHANDATDTSATFIRITPGVKVAFDVVQLSISYRLFQGDSEDAEVFGVDDESTLLAGVGVAFTSDILMQLQYNRLGDYDLGLSFRF